MRGSLEVLIRCVQLLKALAASPNVLTGEVYTLLLFQSNL